MRTPSARQLRDRLDALAWWREMMRVHPGGLVPIPTAARMLGTEPGRIRALIKEGRLPVERWEGGAKGDAFIPVDALYMAPSRYEQGRPLVERSEEGFLRRAGPRPNIYGTHRARPTTWGRSEDISGKDEESSKPLSGNGLPL